MKSRYPGSSDNLVNLERIFLDISSMEKKGLNEKKLENVFCCQIDGQNVIFVGSTRGVQSNSDKSEQSA